MISNLIKPKLLNNFSGIEEIFTPSERTSLEFMNTILKGGGHLSSFKNKLKENQKKKEEQLQLKAK